MFKKSLLILLLFTLSFFISLAFAAPTVSVWDSTIKDSLIDVSDENILDNNDDNGLSLLWWIFTWLKDSLQNLTMLLAVWAFLFIWIRLWMARWNPEEFKKGLMHLVYAIIWIFIITAAWAIVKLFTWFSI